MSFAPPHTCPRCGRVIPAGYCRRCDRSRGTPADRGYTADWQRYSRAWLARFPWCGQRADGQRHPEHSRCTERGLGTRAMLTDHIVPLRAGGSRFDERNLQSLCFSCHRRKTVRESR